MALQRIRFEVDGDVQYSRAFEALASEVDDLSEPLSEVGESLRLSVSEQFFSEGAHGLGVRWRPLNPSYAAWKRSVVGDQPILVFSGQMRSAAISRRAITVGPRRMTYEIDDPKAIYHQRGSGLPQRKIVAVPEAERRAWDRIFANWLLQLRRGPMWAR